SFTKNDSDLFVALGAFEAAFNAYRAFQDTMENYWATVWLVQENVHEINAVVLKEDLVRLEGLPLTARATGIPIEIASKATVKLAITEIDPEQQFIALKYLSVVPTATTVVVDEE
ncbi:RNB domain-containing ribonuclease, partial [Kingella kingae]|nr:RNB domain-containing ribonuclease [Kingella kingae]